MREILIYEIFLAVFLKILREDFFLAIHICIIMMSESLNPASETLYQGSIPTYMPLISYQEQEKPKSPLPERISCVST